MKESVVMHIVVNIVSDERERRECSKRERGEQPCGERYNVR